MCPQKTGTDLSEAAPTISIIMPTFRRADQIGSSLKSLLAGTRQDFELLIFDDGNGRDGTREAIQVAMGNDPRVRYELNVPSRGMPDNINEGIRRARGKYISICHDHDLYEPTFLEEMVACLERNPTAAYVHCGIKMIDQNDDFIGEHVGNLPELTPGGEWLRHMLTRLDCPVCALTLVPRGVHELCGLYNPRFGFVADIELWMRLARHGDVAYIAKPLIRLRAREPGHQATANANKILRTVGVIHSEYYPHVYGPLRTTVQRALLTVRIGIISLKNVVLTAVKRRKRTARE